jgi:hypothetical protein
MCCGEPQHATNQQQDNNQDSENACKIRFWKADDFSVSTTNDALIKAPVRDLVLPFAAITLFLHEPTLSFTKSYNHSNHPVYSFGRAILASNCVLVI